jgi:hypothetical protein
MNVTAIREHEPVTAVPPGGHGTEGVRSLEVRWIFPGQLAAAVVRWFGRFRAGTESRTDTYLLDPRTRGLSVKIRAGGALQVKQYCGSPGMLSVPGRAHGQLQAWQKWSFPFSPVSRAAADPAGWEKVHKRRRISWFSLGGGQIAAESPELAQEARCAVELTEIRVRDEIWWSLGFEVTGPAGLLRGGLEAAAAHVFAQAWPAGVEMPAEYSRSYAEWLSAAGPSRGVHLAVSPPSWAGSDRSGEVKSERRSVKWS